MVHQNHSRTVEVRRPRHAAAQARPPRPHLQVHAPRQQHRQKPTGRRPLSASFLHLDSKPSIVLAETDAQACSDAHQVSFLLASSAEPSPTTSTMPSRAVKPAAAAAAPITPPATPPKSTLSGASANACSSRQAHYVTSGSRSRTTSNSSSSSSGSTGARIKNNGSGRRRQDQRPTMSLRRRPSRHLRILRNLIAADGGDDAEPVTCRKTCTSGRGHRNPDSPLRFDGRLWPSSSRDHPPRCIGGSDVPKYARACSDAQVLPIDGFSPSAIMTRDAFDALPQTIQRKYFSTLERLRIARNPRVLNDFDEATNWSHQRSLSLPLGELDISKQRRRAGTSFDDLTLGPSPLSSSTNSLTASSVKRLSGRRHQSNEELSCIRRRGSVILDATDEAYLRLGRQHCKSRSHGGYPSYLPAAATMARSGDAEANGIGGLGSVTDSFYDCFRWLEDDDTLDLRLHLDDYHFNLREQGVDSSKSHSQRPSFRRHLSISKLPFGGRASEPSNQPESKHDTLPTPSASPVIGSTGHARRKSLALSLISPKQSLPDLTAVMDPTACHYQDPDARMKLRVYLGSPHKFDEAVEFGFPAMDLVPDQDSRKHARRNSDADSPKLHTFLEDDASSLYSETSAGEPESPRTPETSEHPLPMRPIRVSQERGPRVKGDYAQAPACSREMTLRMTLTRPDLRSHEGEMYGWQKKALGRKSSELLSPVMYNTKESIERQFAAIDEEELANGSGVVKRFWNRVRRT